MTAKELYKLQQLHDAYGKHEVKDGYCQKCLCNVRNGHSIHTITSPIVMFRTCVAPGKTVFTQFEVEYLAVMIARYCKATDDAPEVARKLNAPENPALSYYGHKPVAETSLEVAIKIATDLLE